LYDGFIIEKSIPCGRSFDILGPFGEGGKEISMQKKEGRRKKAGTYYLLRQAATLCTISPTSYVESKVSHCVKTEAWLFQMSWREKAILIDISCSYKALFPS
jgi:hypothetical protein